MSLTTRSCDINDIPGLRTKPLHRTIDGLSQGGFPLIRLPSGHRAAHLTRYDDVRAVLMNREFKRACTNIEGGPSWLPTAMPTEMLLNLDVPEHARLKGLSNKLYRASAMAGVPALVSEELERLFTPLLDDRVTDLMSDVLTPLTVRVNCHFLGLPTTEIRKFCELSEEMQMASSKDVPHLRSSFRQLYAYLHRIVAGGVPTTPGLISDLLADGQALEPPLTPDEASAILLGSLVGGDQNVLSTISKALYVMLAKPELWATAVAHPDLIPQIVEELLRVLPLGSISTFPRVAAQEIELPHGTVYSGEIVVADVGRANLDPHVYPDPTFIDIYRSGPKHLQFGYGIHHCMGAALARTEIVETLRWLTHHVSTLELAAPTDAIRWKTGVLIHRPESLPVTASHSAL